VKASAFCYTFVQTEECVGMLGLKWMKVRLLPHEEAWEEEFLRTKSEIARIWGENVLEIEHVGSTAIRNICAKPIIDAAVVIKSFQDMDVEAMEAAGYRYMGARNAEADRYMFAKYGKGSEELVTHHIHIYEPGNQDYIDLVGFRDYLNSHPEVADEYNAIKIKAAEKNPDDRFAYSDAKRNFIEGIISLIQKR